MLTDLACRQAKGKDRPYKLADAHGLFLFVTPKGFRSWRWKYRLGAKEKQLVIGPYPEVSLSAARQAREDASRQLRAGIDPALARREKKEALTAELDNTFEKLARRWHETQRGRWSAKHSADVLSSLEMDVFPEIGTLPLSQVTSRRVLDLTRKIEARPAIETARRVRQRISAAFVFAIADGLATSNPAEGIQPAMATLIKGRQPAFRTIDPARELLRESEAAPAHPLTKLASRLLALTAVRPGVLRFAEPQEFVDLDGPEPVWIVPAAKMKLRQDRKKLEEFDLVVPLSREAVATVREAMRLTAPGPYLFPSTRHAHRPMSENAIGYLYNRIPGYRGRHVPHGWRSTFSTVMNELAVKQKSAGDRQIIDMMLGHQQEGVEPDYNRASHMERRREIAQQWADMLLAGFAPASALIEGPRR